MCKVRRREESYMALGCKPAAALVCCRRKWRPGCAHTKGTAPHTARCSVFSGMRRRKDFQLLSQRRRKFSYP